MLPSRRDASGRTSPHGRPGENLADLSDAPAHEIRSPALSNQGAGPMKPAVGHLKWLVAALAIQRSHCQRYARPLHPTTGKWSDRELRPDQAKLRRGRDFARQRWPFGQFHLTRAGGFVAWLGVQRRVEPAVFGFGDR